GRGRGASRPGGGGAGLPGRRARRPGPRGAGGGAVPLADGAAQHDRAAGPDPLGPDRRPGGGGGAAGGGRAGLPRPGAERIAPSAGPASVALLISEGGGMGYGRGGGRQGAGSPPSRAPA